MLDQLVQAKKMMKQMQNSKGKFRGMPGLGA